MLTSSSDVGEGIEARHHERIFQMFQSLHARDDVESTGIGLALVKKIVEEQGGKVWLPHMNGHEFLQCIKDDPDLCEIPVVIITASDIEMDIVSSFDYGAAGYLIKPATFEKFAQAIANIGLYWTLSGTF